MVYTHYSFCVFVVRNGDPHLLPDPSPLSVLRSGNPCKNAKPITSSFHQRTHTFVISTTLATHSPRSTGTRWFVHTTFIAVSDERDSGARENYDLNGTRFNYFRENNNNNWLILRCSFCRLFTRLVSAMRVSISPRWAIKATTPTTLRAATTCRVRQTAPPTL